MAKQVEIKEPIKLLKEDGSLTQPGWARNNIIEYNRENITAPKWRIKEWDFYQVGCKDWMIQINFLNISVVSAGTIDYVDFKTGEHISDMIPEVWTINKNQLNRNGEKPYVIDYKRGNKQLYFEVTDEIRRLRWKSDKIEIDFTAQNYKGESIVVMTPFPGLPNRFFYTEKINCMPTQGKISLPDGRVIDTEGRDDVYTVLDWGRGPWKHKNYWFWGNGTTKIDGKLFGFEITWGIGDSSLGEETAIIYDGKCHKLGKVNVRHEPDGRWDQPWEFYEENGRFELTMTPFYVHKSGLMTPVLGMLPHQVHGLWNGTVTLDDGTVLKIENMYAFCEKVYNKW